MTKPSLRQWCIIILIGPICVLWDVLFSLVKFIYEGMEKIDEVGGNFLKDLMDR